MRPETSNAGRWEPGFPHAHPTALEWHPLRLQETPLAVSLREGAVCPDDPLPGDAGVVTGGEHGAREPWGARREVPVSGDPARRHGSHPAQHLPRLWNVEVH